MTTSTHPRRERRPAAAPSPPLRARVRTGRLPWIEDTGKVSPRDARELSKLFFDRLCVLEEGSAEYQYARNTLIEMNDSLVRSVARRFRGRGNGEMEDILQVGTIGLIKAIGRFDLAHGAEFATFAIPCILGEIKRYFRDSTWAVHVPRRLQELRLELVHAREELATGLGRQPTVRELARHLRLTEEEVIDGLVAANGYVAGSLDAPTGGDDEGPAREQGRSYADLVGDCDPALERVEDFHTLAPLLERLDARDRLIIELRFGREMTQSEIGEVLGISQMQVSRLIRSLLTRLRAGMLSER